MKDNMTTKPALVIGGTGKTGRRVVERLTARGLPAQHAAHALVEGSEPLGVHHVLEREHGRAVGHRREAVGGRRSDPERRRVGAPKVRVARLEGLQLPVQGVVLGVADLRPVFDVVEPEVADEFGNQRLDSPLRRRVLGRPQEASSAIQVDPGRGR